MSDRLDVVLIDGDTIRLHQQRWGASALVDMLLEGPERAFALVSDGFPQAEALVDPVAGCVIDRARRVLVIAGRAEAITFAGKLRPQSQHLLRELAAAWPGWHLEYEPDHVIEPILFYTHGVGLPLASLDQPHALADHLGSPRFEVSTYILDVPMAPAREAPVEIDRSRSLAELEPQLSFRAANELAISGLLTIGDVLDEDDAGLARLGISERVRREVLELLTSSA